MYSTPQQLCPSFTLCFLWFRTNPSRVSAYSSGILVLAVTLKYKYIHHKNPLGTPCIIATQSTCTCTLNVIHYIWYNPLQWRHYQRDGVSNHQPHDYLFNRLFRHISTKTSELDVTGLCVGKSPVTGEFPAQRASYAEMFDSIWWRHHESFNQNNCDWCIVMHVCFNDHEFLSLLFAETL